MSRPLILLLAFATWSAGMFATGWAWRGDRAEGDEALEQASVGKQHLTAEQGARATEHQQASTLATIGAKHEEDRAAAPAVADAVVADLRSGALRLRNDLAACHTDRLSHAAASAGQRDAAPDLGVTLAGPAVRIGRDADDQLRACQAVVAADRGTEVEVPAGSWNIPVKPRDPLISTGYPQKAERAGPLTT
ncbi:lysis system i-spanin subunit Rz, partial [Stenotrophomonas sp. Bg11-02]